MTKSKKRRPIEVVHDQLQEFGWNAEGECMNYRIWHDDRPDDVEEFNVMQEVWERQKEIEAAENFDGVVSEISVTYNPVKVEGITGIQITCAEEAVRFFRSIWDMNIYYLKESMYVAFLNNARRIIGYYHVSTGGQTGTVVDPADVLRVAILSGASSMILCHNHPSEQARESAADVRITKRIADTGKMIGIPVDDHIILAGDDFVSFSAKGLL